MSRAKKIIKRIVLQTTLFSVIGYAAMRYSANNPHFFANLQETAKERSLEEEIGKEIFAPWGKNLPKREEEQRRVFEKTDIDFIRTLYHRVSANWDNFQRQYHLLRALVVNYDLKMLMEFRPNGDLLALDPRPFLAAELVSYFPNYRADASFLHELAHAWYHHLPKQDDFKMRWKEIAGTDYATHCKPHDKDFFLCRYQDKIIEEYEKAQRSVAAISDYGATNIAEDVAECATFAYTASAYPCQASVLECNATVLESTCEAFQHSLFSIPAGQEERVLKKLDLMAEFGFFSKDEAQKAREAVRFLASH